jgi:hypothetical protein
MYYFDFMRLNENSVQKIYDENTELIYAILGTSETTTNDDPSFTSDGAFFQMANSDTLKINLNSEFTDPQFVSFWLRIPVGSAGTKSSIF